MDQKAQVKEVFTQSAESFTALKATADGAQGSQDAACLFWALEYAGHKSVRLLDGAPVSARLLRAKICGLPHCVQL